ncbi:MAG TPA: antibiotic biosynthesis monooxygenase [Polyangiaceae bacterium]|nr:antibiotic biosynthesis monooxygenase [Polyangiaceae bacterium]
MLVVHVSVVVLPTSVEAFIQATRKNATQSLLEPGILRFDVIQDRADPTRFVLVEVYADDQAPARHKETAHYAEWRDAVEPMMAQPRSSSKYDALFPTPERWLTPNQDIALADTLPGRPQGRS